MTVRYAAIRRTTAHMPCVPIKPYACVLSFTIVAHNRKTPKEIHFFITYNMLGMRSHAGPGSCQIPDPIRCARRTMNGMDMWGKAEFFRFDFVVLLLLLRGNVRVHICDRAIMKCMHLWVISGSDQQAILDNARLECTFSTIGILVLSFRHKLYNAYGYISIRWSGLAIAHRHYVAIHILPCRQFRNSQGKNYYICGVIAAFEYPSHQLLHHSIHNYEADCRESRGTKAPRLYNRKYIKIINKWIVRKTGKKRRVISVDWMNWLLIVASGERVVKWRLVC